MALDGPLINQSNRLFLSGYTIIRHISVLNSNIYKSENPIRHFFFNPFISRALLS